MYLLRKVNKITLSANDDKIMKSVHSIKAYAYGTNKDLLNEKEELKYNNSIK